MATDHLDKWTALAVRNRIECDECGDPIEGGLKRTVRWGRWDAEAQNFEYRAKQDHYCADCWRERFEREAAAYYEVEDAEKFWNILEAADGDLVGDLRPIFVGGRPWIRVADGELQGMNSTIERADDPETLAEDEQPTIKFGVEEVDVDREWFDETFRAEEDLPDDEMPTIALLKPADETPFEDYESLPEDQTTLDNLDQERDGE